MVTSTKSESKLTTGGARKLSPVQQARAEVIFQSLVNRHGGVRTMTTVAYKNIKSDNGFTKSEVDAALNALVEAGRIALDLHPCGWFEARVVREKINSFS